MFCSPLACITYTKDKGKVQQTTEVAVQAHNGDQNNVNQQGLAAPGVEGESLKNSKVDAQQHLVNNAVDKGDQQMGLAPPEPLLGGNQVPDEGQGHAGDVRMDADAENKQELVLPHNASPDDGGVIPERDAGSQQNDANLPLQPPVADMGLVQGKEDQGLDKDKGAEEIAAVILPPEAEDAQLNPEKENGIGFHGDDQGVGVAPVAPQGNAGNENDLQIGDEEGGGDGGDDNVIGALPVDGSDKEMRWVKLQGQTLFWYDFAPVMSKKQKALSWWLWVLLLLLFGKLRGQRRFCALLDFDVS